jgi:hypothetical protein
MLELHAHGCLWSRIRLEHIDGLRLLLEHDGAAKPVVSDLLEQHGGEAHPSTRGAALGSSGTIAFAQALTGLGSTRGEHRSDTTIAQKRNLGGGATAYLLRATEPQLPRTKGAS